MMLHVAAYTGGITIPGARFRVRQYLPELADAGVAVTEFVSRFGQYPPVASWQRPAWVVARLCEAGLQAATSHRYDLVLFQRELFSTFVTFESLFGRQRVLDVDDAIWAHSRGSFAMRLAQLCDAVICGNDYLAEYFAASGRQIYVLPTAVDTTRFVPRKVVNSRPPIVGWSGTRGNLRSLESIEPSLAIIMKRFADLRLRVICHQAPK
ncbi:MAG: group 1 glycosyl transferase, partial [Gammaproteobacteria bacterium]